MSFALLLRHVGGGLATSGQSGTLTYRTQLLHYRNYIYETSHFRGHAQFLRCLLQPGDLLAGGESLAEEATIAALRMRGCYAALQCSCFY